MKSRLLATVASIGLVTLAFVSPAHAVFIDTTNTLFTAPNTGILRVIYEGFSAADTDNMRIAANGATVFQNISTPGGTVYDLLVTQGQQVRLQLYDVSTGDTWFSGTTENSDGAVHLRWATAFSDFGIGAPLVSVITNCVGPGGACYLGWEDRRFPGADGDFNDLTFALRLDPITPTPNPAPSILEPASLSLLGTALVGMGWLARRRRKTV